MPGDATRRPNFPGPTQDFFAALDLAHKAVDRFMAMQKPRELAGLIELVRAVLEPGDAILELGSDAGGTLFVWTRLCAHVVGVDKPNGAFGTGRGLIDYGATVIRGDSHHPVIQHQVLEALGGHPTALLFIDGDHSLEGVTRDFDDYKTLVRPGGLIALHDICHHETDTGCRVDELWEQLRARYRTDQLIAEPRTWGGIGVIHVA